MKKNLRQRTISLLTAAVTGTASLSLGTLFAGAEGAGEASTASPVFSVEGDEALGWNSANALYADLSFKDVTGQPYDITIPDNTYYLLVHAVGKDNPNGFPPYTYDEGEVKDYYKLIEIDADGDSWNSGAFNVLPSKDVPWGWDGSTVPAYPATAKVEGFILRNSDPASELTIDNVLDNTGFEAVNTIEGLSVNSADSLTKRTSPYPGWSNDTFELTAELGQKVNINVYDYTGENLEPINARESTRYYAVSTIYPKGVSQNNDNVAGWSVDEFFPEENAQTTIPVVNFTPSEGTEPIVYNADEYTIKTRVYTFDEQLYSFGQALSFASDNIPDYRCDRNTISENTTTIDFIRDTVEYQIELNFDKPVTITPDDNIYVLVNVTHATTDDTYYAAKVTGNNTDKIVIPVQTADDTKFVRGSEVFPDNRVTGSEDIDLKLIKTSRDVQPSSLADFTEKTILENGMLVKGQSLEYKGIIPERDEQTYVTTLKDTVNFTSVEISEVNYTFKDILGQGRFFGLTADRVEMKAHDIQSNVATNYFGYDFAANADGLPINPNLSGESSGAIAIAKYVDFGGSTEITDDTKIYSLDDIKGPGNRTAGRVRIGDKSATDIHLYT